MAWIANSEAGSSVRDKLNGIIKTVAVTTGASPVDITLSDYGNWQILNVEVTSGGTQGTEVINFVGPGMSGSTNNSYPGRTLNVVFVHQADPSDVIHITQNTTGNFNCIDSVGNSVGSFGTGVFDEEGNNLTFGFNGDVIQQYAWNCLYGAWNSPTVISGKKNPLPSGGAYGDMLFAGPAWGSAPLKPFPVFNAIIVSALNSDSPAASNNLGMAHVGDADTPVVGSPVVGGGSARCVVISNGTDYIVMFVFP